jgi:MoxR-like ATPase
LPEAQLDRFLVRLSMGYPGKDGEIQMLERQHREHPLEKLNQVVGIQELTSGQLGVKDVRVDPALSDYMVSIVDATRRHEDVHLGASPRGSLALYNAARALAAIRGRLYVMPDDVKALAEPTLAHRVIVKPSARIRNVDSRAVIRDIVLSVPVPGVRPQAGGRGIRAAD